MICDSNLFVVRKINASYRFCVVKWGLILDKFSNIVNFFFAYNDFSSIFFGPEYLTITILAPCLVFLGSLLSDFSRELGQLFPGLVSGIMFVLAVLYCFEPAILGILGDLEMGDAIWKTFRLAVLCATVLFAAKLLINAWLLVWVKEFMEKNPSIDYDLNGDGSFLDNEAVIDTEA